MSRRSRICGSTGQRRCSPVELESNLESAAVWRGPCHLQLAPANRTVPKIQVDQALVGEGRILSHGFEVGHRTSRMVTDCFRYLV